MTNIVISITNTVNGDIFLGTVSVHTSVEDTFWKGFAFVLVVGLAMMGARWVRQIIGGSHESND